MQRIIMLSGSIFFEDCYLVAKQIFLRITQLRPKETLFNLF